MNSTSSWESVIQQIETLNLNEQVNLIHCLVDNLVDKLQQTFNVEQIKSPISLVSMIGAGKGCYASPEEVDQFLRQEREQWD